MSMFGCTSRDGAARPAPRTLKKEQELFNRRARRAPYVDPAIAAVCKAFDCTPAKAKKIIKAAKRAAAKNPQ